MTPDPREAATLVLMRERRGAAPEVLMVRRHGKDAFAGGAFVFPGGVLEEQDCSAEALALSTVVGPGEAAGMLRTTDSPERALGHFVAAIRETFEETGVLLAKDRFGRPWRPDAGETAALAEARAAMRLGRIPFARWLGERGLRPAIEDLIYFAHWITPLGLPRRFDTRFFLATADAGAVAEPDQAEVVECRWITPPDAVAAYRSRSMQMVNATIRNIELLAGYTSTEQARERLRGREIAAITPKLVREGDGFRVVNPWEAGYDGPGI